MRLSFLGATGTVTGSKYLLETDRNRILVDCGLYQGIKNLRRRNWQALPYDPKSIDAVLLTHAHIDHSGYLPALVKQGFKGPIYCSPGTKDLCSILLPDAGHLQEEDAKYANRKGFSKHHPAEPLFTSADAVKCLNYFESIPFNDSVNIAPGLEATFTPAGHILGASCIKVFHKGISTVFSGDLGRPNDLLMYPPAPIKKADYLILESTYGNRRHKDIDVMSSIRDIITKTVGLGGSVLFPAFAVGRAQLVLHILSKLKSSGEIPNAPVYLNSPMATKATQELFRHNDEVRLSKDDCRQIDANTRYIDSVEESVALDRLNGPKIIVSASGMASGGRVLHHLKSLLNDTRNSIVFTGYQAPGTRGDAMVNGATHIKIHGRYYPVRAVVHQFNGISAHADYEEMLDWLRSIDAAPRKVFITHGEPAASDSLRLKLKDEFDWDVDVPEYLDSVEID